VRILVINNTFNYPSMGGIRSRLLVRGLAGAGHRLVVVTSTHDSGERLNHPRIEEVRVETGLRHKASRSTPSGREATGPAPAKPAAKVGKGGRWKNELNRWLMIPDKFVFWVPSAVAVAGRLHKAEAFDVVYATMPVRSNLVAGARIAAKYRIPLVIEYRDLWTDSPYAHNAEPTRLHEWIHRRLERYALRRATRIAAVCKGIQSMIQRKARKPVSLNYNFFDPATFIDLEKPAVSNTFTIVYAGALYGSRQPFWFFRGLRLFLDQQDIAADRIRFRCIGAGEMTEEMRVLIDSLELKGSVEFLPRLSHREALGHLCAADASLILQAEGDTIHIPGKLFEAFGARTPILLVTEPCEVADLVNDCAAGVVCSHTAESVAAGLAVLHEKWRSGASWKFNEDAVAAYRLDRAVAGFEELLRSALRNQPWAG